VVSRRRELASVSRSVSQARIPSEPLLVFLALVVLAGFLWPTLGMPYLGDNTFNAYLDGWIGYERLSLGEAFRQFFVATNVSVGRFYPVFPLIIFFDFHVVHDATVLKALVLVAIVLNALTFYALVRMIAPALALPTLVVLPATLQIRFFHDPIVQFSLHMQVAFEFVLLGMLGLAAFAETRRAVYAVLSVAAYALAALTYEATYAFVIIYAFLGFALVRDVRARAWLCGAYAFVPLACSAAAIAIRQRVPVPAASPYALHFDAAAVAHTIWLQTLGAIPLSYAFWNPAGFLPPLTRLWRSFSPWAVAIISFGLALAAFARSGTSRNNRREPAATAFGALLVVLSTVLIALSTRWQRELTLGLAYTPVYFEAFGIALVFAAVGVGLMRRLPRAGTGTALSLVTAFLVGTTYRANALVLAHYTAWSTIVPRALDAGLLSDARPGDTVYLDNSYPAHAQDAGGRWDVRYYLFAHTHERLIPSHLADLPSAVGPRSFALEAAVQNFTTGRVVAGRVTSVARVAGVNVPLVSNARQFEATPNGATLTALQSHCGPIPIANLRDNIGSALLVRYDPAFSFLENDGGVPFRWASGPGLVFVDNPTERLRHATLSFALRPANAASHVRVRAGAFTLDRSSNGDDVPAVFTVAVAPHGSAAIAVDADGAPVIGNPGGRVLRYEVRNMHILDSDCVIAR